MRSPVFTWFLFVDASTPVIHELAFTAGWETTSDLSPFQSEAKRWDRVDVVRFGYCHDPVRADVVIGWTTDDEERPGRVDVPDGAEDPVHRVAGAFVGVGDAEHGCRCRLYPTGGRGVH